MRGPFPSCTLQGVYPVDSVLFAAIRRFGFDWLTNCRGKSWLGSMMANQHVCSVEAGPVFRGLMHRVISIPAALRGKQCEGKVGFTGADAAYC